MFYIKIKVEFICENWVQFFKIFSMWTIFKVVIELVTVLLLCFLRGTGFGPKACGILAP